MLFFNNIGLHFYTFIIIIFFDEKIICMMCWVLQLFRMKKICQLVSDMNVHDMMGLFKSIYIVCMREKERVTGQLDGIYDELFCGFDSHCGIVASCWIHVSHIFSVTKCTRETTNFFFYIYIYFWVVKDFIFMQVLRNEWLKGICRIKNFRKQKKKADV